jgi:hypothetical protein
MRSSSRRSILAEVITILSGGPAMRHMLRTRDGRRALKRAVRRGMAVVVREAGI